MAIFNINSKKIADLETRVSTLERQILEVTKKNLAKLDDQPPTILHQFAINQIIRMAREFAERNPRTINSLEDECLTWLEAMGR